MRDHVTFLFRGEPVTLRDFPPTRSLLDWLREDRRAVGTKEGCNEGDCGACTVVLARVEEGRLVHRPVNACITFVGMADGAELITVEDLADGGRLHPIQQAMVDHHGSQCGFCTPGIVMSLFAMAKEGGEVDRNRINDQLAGNLCRCTGYRPIVDAAMASAGATDRFDGATEARIAALRALDEGAGALVAADDGFFAVPRTLGEALELYAAHPDATILAGATDVGLWITKQFRPIRKLIWLGRVAELQHVDDGEAVLRLGAGVSHEAALPGLSALSPDLGELGRRFGSKQVRARAPSAATSPTARRSATGLRLSSLWAPRWSFLPSLPPAGRVPSAARGEGVALPLRGASARPPPGLAPPVHPPRKGEG